jgi:adenosine deaminase
MNLLEKIFTAPKAELHLHIEGTLEPELIFALAQKNKINLTYISVEALRTAYAFTDLQSFLDLYYAGASVLQTEDDFYAMTMAYFARAKADNIVHAEIFFDPQTHTERGIAIGTVFAGLSRARVDAAQKFGISSELILCFLRHLSEADAFKTLQEALPYRQHFIGVGLDSGERGNPPEKFKNVFAESKKLGLRLVAHAGEEGPAEYVETAIDVLNVERIDHGVRSIESAALVQKLARAGTPLTVCPLSNTKLCVFKTMREHTLKTLLDAGVCVMINSDDPAYFGGYLNANFKAIFENLPLTEAEALQLLKNSFTAAFISDTEKLKYTALLEKHFQTA